MMTPAPFPKNLQERDKAHRNRGTLIWYAMGIYAAYLMYGYFQEYLMKEGRFGEGKERFTYNAFLLLVQGIFNLVAAYIAISWKGDTVRDNVPSWSYALSAGSQLAAMSFSFYALNFVDYPTQALAKACKPIPVMVVGLLLFAKRYHWSKYFTVTIITGGIAVFMVEQEQVHAKIGDDPGLYGFSMLFISLLLDGMTGSAQDRLVSSYKPTANHLMFHSNLWSTLFSFITVLVLGELGPALDFCQRNPAVWYYIVGQSLASALGQLFIYRLIRSYGSLTLSILTTSRKFFSILLSIVYFDHTLTILQWTSVLAVFLGLGFDSISPKPDPTQQEHHQHHHHPNHAHPDGHPLHHRVDTPIHSRNDSAHHDSHSHHKSHKKAD